MDAAALRCSALPSGAATFRKAPGPCRVTRPARVVRCAVRPRAVAEAQASVPFLSSADHLAEWGPQSWRAFKALQQPEYPDKVCMGLGWTLLVGGWMGLITIRF